MSNLIWKFNVFHWVPGFDQEESLKAREGKTVYCSVLQYGVSIVRDHVVLPFPSYLGRPFHLRRRPWILRNKLANSSVVVGFRAWRDSEWEDIKLAKGLKFNQYQKYYYVFPPQSTLCLISFSSCDV